MLPGRFSTGVALIAAAWLPAAAPGTGRPISRSAKTFNASGEGGGDETGLLGTAAAGAIAAAAATTEEAGRVLVLGAAGRAGFPSGTTTVLPALDPLLGF